MTASTVVIYTRVASGARAGEAAMVLVARLREAGHQVIVVPTLTPFESNTSAPGPARFDVPVALGHAQAVVVVSASASAPLLTQIADAGIPLVLADRETDRADLPVVRSDDAGAARLAVEHLVQHGHRRIGFVGSLRHPVARRRYAAYHASLLRHGLVPEPDDEFLVPESESTGGRKAARLFLDRTDRPTALLVASDTAAVGVLAELAAAGVAVPDDVAVVCFEDGPITAFSDPPLTSVSLPPVEVSERVARLVRRALGGRALRPGVRVPRATHLVARRSCGCGAPGEPERWADPRAHEGAAEHWYGVAGSLLSRALTAEATLGDEYRIDVAIFADPDVSRLAWLSGVRVRGASLALWRDRVAETLTIVGWHADDDPALAAQGDGLIGTQTTAWDFPPAPLLGVSAADPSLGVLVVPVETGQRVWGLLAVVADYREPYGVEIVRHWAALLAIALDRQELADAVRRSEARHAAATRARNDGLWEYRRWDGSIYASERTRELLGAPTGHLVTKDWWIRQIHPEDRDAMIAMLTSALQHSTAPVSLEYRIGTPANGYRWMLTRAVGITGSGGEVDQVVGSLTDIDRRRTLEERLRYTALHDSLTGLANRVRLMERLSEALAARDDGEVSSVGLIFIDLDDFKAVNDRFGHLVGDDLLRIVAGRLPTVVREGDVPARYGGDEFAVLLLDATEDELVRVAGRVRDAVAQAVTLTGSEVRVTASVGVAATSEAHSRAEDLLRAADTAMYHAKSAGQGLVCLAGRDGAFRWPLGGGGRGVDVTGDGLAAGEPASFGGP